MWTVRVEKSVNWFWWRRESESIWHHLGLTENGDNILWFFVELWCLFWSTPLKLFWSLFIHQAEWVETWIKFVSIIRWRLGNLQRFHLICVFHMSQVYQNWMISEVNWSGARIKFETYTFLQRTCWLFWPAHSWQACRFWSWMGYEWADEECLLLVK